MDRALGGVDPSRLEVFIKYICCFDHSRYILIMRWWCLFIIICDVLRFNKSRHGVWLHPVLICVCT